jgi:transposase InsO family protein
MRLRWILPTTRHQGYIHLMRTVNQALGFDASEVAKFRFRCIQILEKQGFEGVKLAFPEVGRRSVFRWQAKYLKSGRKLTSLIPKSTKPHKLREMIVPAKILGFLKQLRQNYPHLSKYKLKPFLDIFCQENKLKIYSVSWIGKVLSTRQLFFESRRPTKRHRKRARSGYRVHHCPKTDKLEIGYLELDGVKVYFEGKTLYFLSAIELKTRQAFAKRVLTISSKQTSLFLEEILKQISYRVHTIHTDNGSEFHALFDQAVQDLNITKLWSPPRTPKVHAHIERFNKTLQEEFVDYHVDQAIDQPTIFNQELSDWLIWYNTKRPHHSLNLMTPSQYLLQLQKGSTQSAKCA